MVHINQPYVFSPLVRLERDRQIYLWRKRRNVNCVFWVMCAAAAVAPSHFPLGRRPLLSFNLCLLLIHSPLGTLMRGVWREPFPRPWAGLKRTELPLVRAVFRSWLHSSRRGKVPTGWISTGSTSVRGVRRVGWDLPLWLTWEKCQ